MLLVQQIILNHIFLRKVIHFSNDIIKEFTIMGMMLYLLISILNAGIIDAANVQR